MSKLRSNKKVAVLLHLAGWIIILVIPLYLFNTEWPTRTSFTGKFYFNALIYGIIFYTNYFFLIPKFYMKKKYLFYLAGVVILVLILFYVQRYFHPVLFSESAIEKEFGQMISRFNDEHNFSGPPFKGFFLYNFFFTSILISGFSLGLRVSERFTRQEKLQEELVKENLKTELALLKNQVSPHFFFNTLNNIYAMIETKTGDAREAVLQLSRLMRYLLYESEQPMVNISREVEFMRNYIRLMALRLSEKVDLQVSFPEIREEIMLPPLLFIPLIENAFKHGVSYKENCYIHLSLNLEGNSLQFESRNRLIKQDEQEEPVAGIGIENVRKRLELLYPGQATLEIVQEMNSFIARITINPIR